MNSEAAPILTNARMTTMDDALILSKLEALTEEIRLLKGEIAELRQGAAAAGGMARPRVEDCFSADDLAQREEDFAHFQRSLVLNAQTLNSLMTTAKGAMELKDEIEPLAKILLPKVIEMMGELEGQYHPEDIAALVRNTLTNLHHFNTAIIMLKAGMELKDEIEPLAKLVYPRMIELFHDLEGQYNLDDVTALLRNTLGSLNHFNTAITMLRAGMELKDEIEPLAKLTLPKIIETFNELDGTLRVAGAGLQAAKSCAPSPAQAEAMIRVIADLDLSNVPRVGPLGAVKKLYDPNVQEALGLGFALIEALGALLRAWRDGR